MRIILILILLLQAITAYYTWASYKLDKDFTDNMGLTEEPVEEEQSNEIHV